ncbi:MAG: lipocalin family protein [Bacteroidota bacterium]
MKASAFAAMLLAVLFSFSANAHPAISSQKAASPVGSQNGEIFHPAFQPLSETAEISAIQNHLVGSWTNVSRLSENTKNKELKSAFLRLELRADGTFTFTYGTKSKQMEEHGTWEVSASGQFLLMQTIDSQETKVAKIASSDEESLVLECLHSFGFCQFFNLEVASLTFIK